MGGWVGWVGDVLGDPEDEFGTLGRSEKDLEVGHVVVKPRVPSLDIFLWGRVGGWVGGWVGE